MDYSPDATSRFVCPNDRQLALRAKLKTGWSVKTACVGYNQPSNNLREDEQAVIIDVIKRAEKVDQLEQERVGKLVEKFENLRRNALGRDPNQCLLCGDGFGVFITQKFVCIDCRKLVCIKCAINASPNKTRRNSNPFATKSTLYFANSKDRWLCMICAESREIWKKSGAWFFKALPKYVLPSQIAPPLRFNRSCNSSKRSKKRFKDDSSSDEERPFWPKIERRNSSTESTHDAQEITFQEDKENQKEAVIFTLEKEDDFKLELASGESSELSRRDSLASRTISDWNWNSDAKSEDRVSPGACSVTSSIFKNPIEEHKPLDASMGLIELSLNYDPMSYILHCTVYRAKNLEAMDINGLADPFCKLNILPNEKESTRLRTKTVHKTRNPEFNENLTFYNLSEEDLVKKYLYILVLDDDKYGHDYLGETRINLAKLRIQNTIYLTVPLEKTASPELTHWIEDLFARGRILLSLCYNTKRRALLVTVCRCENLLPMDNNGYSDPFVKLLLRPDPHHRKHKTSIKWKELNPIFNEEFAFETRPTELSTQSLHIAVWDKDYGKSNDYLGGLVLGGMGSKGQRLKHWLDMIRYPDHKQERWHHLTEDPIGD
nr:synaptotagmin-like protein 2 [Onthophagus taurus]